VPPPPGALHGQSVGFGRNGQAWSTTATATQVLLRTSQGWQTVTLPVAPATGDSIAVNGDTIVAVGLKDESMVVQTSADLGATWSTQTVASNEPTTEAAVALSTTTGRFVAAPRHVGSIGAVHGSMTVYVGGRGAAGRQITLPGEAAFTGWAGDVLLSPAGSGIGGPTLFRSDDAGATWTDLTKAITGAAWPDDPATGPYFGPVLSLADGTAVVLEETLTEGVGISAKVLRFTADGAYTQIASLTVPGNVGGPMDLLVSTYGTDAIAVAHLDGQAFDVVNVDGTVTTIAAAGLPAAPEALSFQDETNGLAQVTVSGCTGDKTGCTSVTTIHVTTDGGHTWSAV